MRITHRNLSRTAGSIFGAMGMLCEITKYGKEMRLGYLRSALDALNHVPDSQAGAVGLAAEVRGWIKM